MRAGETSSLLWVRRRILRNLLIRPTWNHRVRWGLILLLGILFVWGDYYFFHRVIQHLSELPFQIGEELLVQLLNVVCLTFFVMVLFGALIVSLSVFFMAPDLALLHSLPLKTEAITWVRFSQTVVYSSWMVLLFSLPMFAAYGNYLQLSWEYYLFLGMALIPFVTLPCLLGALVIMGVVRYFPTKRLHQILSCLGVVFLSGLVVYFRFLSPEVFFGKEVSDENIIQFVEELKIPAYAFLPSSWLTRGTTAWAAAENSIVWTQLSYLWMACLMACVLFHNVARKIYFSGWLQIQEAVGAPQDRRSRQKRIFSLWEKLPIAPQSRALLVKDFKAFTRDPEQWSQMFILAALVVVYIFNIMNLPLENQVLREVVSVLNIGLVGFVLSALVSRFVFSAPSMEGKNLWVVYSAPVDMGRFMRAKFALFFPPLLIMAEFLVLVSNYLLQVDGYVMNVSIAGVFLITLGLVGLGLGLGAMYPEFDYENVSAIPMGTGGILFMIIGMGFVGLVLVLLARPMFAHFNEKFLSQAIGGLEVPLCYALIIILTVMVTLIPLRRGISRLKQMDI